MNPYTDEIHFKALADRFVRWREAGFASLPPTNLP